MDHQSCKRCSRFFGENTEEPATTFGWNQGAPDSEVLCNSLPEGHGLVADLMLVRRSEEHASWLELAESDTYNLSRAPQHVFADRSIVMDAVRIDGDALRYASDELRADPVVVIEALHRSGGPLIYASEKLLRNRDFIMSAVKRNGNALGHAPDRFRSDREIILAALAENPDAIEHALVSERMWADSKFVLCLMRHNIDAIFSAADNLWYKREFVLGAMQLSEDAMIYAD